MNNSNEEAFLAELKRTETSITVFLLTGTKLQGILADYDDGALFLRREGHTQMIFKHAVSTVMPSLALQFGKKMK